jgi:spore coat polysaccharide biosynthesis predicted glycosyltransferase SpsG
MLAPRRFRAALEQATVAVVAGGTTLYEACALGTPVIAVPVVPGQATTVRRFVRAGLAAGARPRSGAAVGSDRWGQAIAAAALDLLADADRRAALSARGPRVIDGRGAQRVAQAIAGLVRRA